VFLSFCDRKYICCPLYFGDEMDLLVQYDGAFFLVMVWMY
jgi:hypothetical protein